MAPCVKLVPGRRRIAKGGAQHTLVEVQRGGMPCPTDHAAAARRGERPSAAKQDEQSERWPKLSGSKRYLSVGGASKKNKSQNGTKKQNAEKLVFGGGG